MPNYGNWSARLKPEGRTIKRLSYSIPGFALEDYSILRTVYELATAYQLGTELPLIPELDDPKNLFGLLDSSHPGSP